MTGSTPYRPTLPPGFPRGVSGPPLTPAVIADIRRQLAEWEQYADELRVIEAQDRYATADPGSPEFVVWQRAKFCEEQAFSGLVNRVILRGRLTHLLDAAEARTP